LTCPPDFIELINNHAYEFVWNKKPEKIKRLTFIAEYENGGLKMLDTEFFKSSKSYVG
jgi:hypothetical protein